MITKFSIAHDRMLSNPSVQVRTHHAQDRRPPPPSKGSPERPRCGERPINVKGVTYSSMKKACKDLHCGMNTLYRMIDRGEANYA